MSKHYSGPQPEMGAYVLERCVPLLDGCWAWDRGLKESGYGVARTHEKTITAHRLSYLAFNGEIPAGLCVLHKCDVRVCVNPEHLFLGTHRDNAQDMVRKGRHYSHYRGRPTCPAGHSYTPATTHLSKKGKRVCRTCHRERMRRVRSERRARDVGVRS